MVVVVFDDCGMFNGCGVGGLMVVGMLADCSDAGWL
jgi:hypothetical protein